MRFPSLSMNTANHPLPSASIFVLGMTTFPPFKSTFSNVCSISSQLKWISTPCDEGRKSIPNFICESPDENGIASLVAKDFGIALVADVDTIHRDDICIRPLISQETFSHTVYMGYMRGKYQLPAVQRFIQFVRRMYH